MNTKITQNVKSIILALIMVLGVGYVMAWTGAPANPPSNNVEAPINASSSSQYKRGALSLGTASQPAPGSILDVVGNIATQGLSVSGASIFNGEVQVRSGSPAAGKVLTAVNASGTMAWTDPALVSESPTGLLKSGIFWNRGPNSNFRSVDLTDLIKNNCVFRITDPANCYLYVDTWSTANIAETYVFEFVVKYYPNDFSNVTPFPSSGEYYHEHETLAWGLSEAEPTTYRTNLSNANTDGCVWRGAVTARFTLCERRANGTPVVPDPLIDYVGPWTYGTSPAGKIYFSNGTGQNSNYFTAFRLVKK